MPANRKVIDCRWFPAYVPCEFAASGDEEDVLDIAVQHAVEYHGYPVPSRCVINYALCSAMKEERKPPRVWTK